MKPKQVFYFLIITLALLGLISIVFPKEGIKIFNKWTLNFPNIEDFTSPSKINININTDSIAQNQLNIEDIVLEQDSVAGTINIEEIKKMVVPLEFPATDTTVLNPLFDKLTNISKEQKVRILHYGDSQIEGDRITAFFRNKLQSRFGGHGMGLCSPIAVYAAYSMAQKDSKNWQRYTAFGSDASRNPHNSYGAMLAYNRFSPLTDSTWKQPENKYTAWIEFSKSSYAFENTKKFKEVYIYYGNAKVQTAINIIVNDNSVKKDSLLANNVFNVYAYKSSEYIDNIKFEFETYDSPDFYAISFEDETGVYADNIALRGSSGNVFTKVNGLQLRSFYSYLGVDLFILEFGENAVPYALDLASAQGIGNTIYYQISYLKNLVPGACFIVIGPGDMATKDKETYVSYPNLPNIINELKKATHRAGGVYWDMYQAMGGENSMVAWVNAEKPLAGADYVHLNPAGVSIIANMFYNAFIYEYTKYIEHKKNNK